MKFLPLFSLIVAAVAASSVLAQDDTPTRQIEEIIVTADRLEKSIQDTPIAVTALPTAFIETFGVRNQEDLQNFVPSLTVQPYDIAIRGVGRNFRGLGGEPGVATYHDNVYVEDFIGPSTEHGLYDLARIEFLKGPQGTLYGRNGIGGAVNFFSNQPEFQFSSELRTVLGEYNTAEIYGYVTGPLIKDKLAGRFVYSNRERDGFVDELGIGDDLDSQGDEAYSLSLTFEPTDALRFYLRGSERNAKRVIAGAFGGEAFVVSENFGFGDEVTGGKRNTTARVFGLRQVDPGLSCASLIDRTTPTCTVPDRQVFEYNWNGVTRFAQRVVPGVDFATHRPNRLFNHDTTLAQASALGDGTTIPDIDGSDLQVDTNGLNEERFENQAVYLNVDWEVSDYVALKYIGGYTESFYERNLDSDYSSSPDQDQRYTNFRTRNFQHELQLFADIGDSVQLTAGLFYYEADVFLNFDSYSRNPREADAPSYGFDPVTGDALSADGIATLLFGFPLFSAFSINDPAQPFDAQGICPETVLNGQNPVLNTSLTALNEETIVASCSKIGPSIGDAGYSVRGGPETIGSFAVGHTDIETEAKAVYAQLEWEISDAWSLIAGARWAEDVKTGEEDTWATFELDNLNSQQRFGYNVLTGALNPDGTPTDASDTYIRFRGLPVSFSSYRKLKNTWDQTTWRLNLDYIPTDNTLIYGSVTTGYRAGGYNLGSGSSIPVYDNEDLTAYEIGIKTRLFRELLQINSALYRYDYENIHVPLVIARFATEGDSLGGGQSTANDTVQNAPEAVNQGLEIEATWLPTDHLQLGFSYSYADATFTEELRDPRSGQLGVVDRTNPLAPVGVYTLDERRIPIKGARLPRIPEHKFSIHMQYSWFLKHGNLDLVSAYSWTDEVSFRVSDSDLSVAPSWGRWDARLIWTNSTRRFTGSLFVNNITDEIGVRGISATDVQSNFIRAVTPTIPRFVGIDLRYRFGGF